LVEHRSEKPGVDSSILSLGTFEGPAAQSGGVFTIKVWISMKNEAFQIWAAMSATVAVLGVVAWAVLARVFARMAPAGPGRNLSAAALLVGPFVVLLELWAIPLSFGNSWPPLRPIIAVGGVIALSVVPFLSAKMSRLAPELRRRASANLAIIIVSCTLIAELMVYVQPSWEPWIAAAALVYVVILAAQKRLTRS
jgi:hypothetical protein